MYESSRVWWLSFIGFISLTLWSVYWHTVNGSWTLYEWPALDNVPLILRLKDPGYLTNDFYSNASVGTPREIFSGFIWWICSVFSLQWWEAFFLFKVIVTAFTLPLLYLAIVSHSPWRKHFRFHFIFCVFASYALYRNSVGFSVFGGFMPFFGEPIALTFAILLSFVAMLSLASSHRLLQTIGMIGFFLSSVFHPVMGVCATSFFCVLVLVSNPIHSRSTWILAATSLMSALAGAMVIGFIYASEAPLALDKLIKIYVVDRHPHHYLMSDIFRGHRTRYFNMALILLLPAALGAYLRQRWLVLMSSLFFLTFAAFNFAQYLFVEVLPIRAAVHFGFTRFNIFIYWLVAILYSSLSTSLSLRIVNKSFPSPCEKYLTYKSTRVLTSLGILLFSIIITLTTYNSHIFNPLQILPKDHRDILLWLKDNTPKDSVVQPIGGVDTFNVRIFAERAVTSEYGFTFNESAIEEWYERWGRGFQMVDGIPKVTKFRLDYFVMPSAVAMPCKSVYSNEGFAVYETKSCKELHL